MAKSPDCEDEFSMMKTRATEPPNHRSAKPRNHRTTTNRRRKKPLQCSRRVANLKFHKCHLSVSLVSFFIIMTTIRGGRSYGAKKCEKNIREDWEKGSKCQVERGNVLHKLANVIKFYKGMCGTGTLAFNAATEKI